MANNKLELVKEGFKLTLIMPLIIFPGAIKENQILIAAKINAPALIILALSVNVAHVANPAPHPTGKAILIKITTHWNNHKIVITN